MAISADKLVDMMVVALVLGVLIGIVADYTIGVANTGNITGTTATVIVLIPLAIVLAVVIGYFKMVRN